MDTSAVTGFLVNYWWALAIAAGIILFAILARKGILGKRAEELFSWPPQV